MWVSIITLDRVALIPGWALCIAFGVLMAWLRWRSPWGKS